MQTEARILQNNRYERFLIQNTARHILIGEGLKHKLPFAENFHRTAKCTHTRILETVSIKKSNKNKAFYSGLAVCGNVWVCPICANKIQEQRRKEIAHAFDWAYSFKKKVIMVTFTFPHSRDDSLKSLLDGQAKAFDKFRAGNPWKRIKDKIGFWGLIRSLEVTYGLNGWHPHTHEAWIVDKNTDTDLLRHDIAMRWLKKCQASGLVSKDCSIEEEQDFYRHSVDIMDNCHTSDYLAKQDDSKHWGADRELAKASTKHGKKNKGRHIFGILKDIEEIEDNKQDTAIFLEYVHAIKRKRQVFWSPGLKDKVKLKELTDKEIAESEPETIDIFAQLSAYDWKVIIDRKAKSKVLDIAENGTLQEMKSWLYNNRIVNTELENIPGDNDITLRIPSKQEIQEQENLYNDSKINLIKLPSDVPNFYLHFPFVTKKRPLTDYQIMIKERVRDHFVYDAPWIPLKIRNSMEHENKYDENLYFDIPF